MIHDIEAVQGLVQEGVARRTYPGAVWAAGDRTGSLAGGVCGTLDGTEPMLAGTVFDIASLTKVTTVWAVLGCLRKAGRLPLDDSLGTFWTEVAGHPLGQVTARQLLTHSAGVPLRANLRNSYGSDEAAVRAGVLQEALHRPPGEAVEYTDRAALILGFLAEYLTGTTLDQLASQTVWKPLGMTETRFGPVPPDLVRRCAPTEVDETTGQALRGTAHDFSARLLGGVCGIAGVFSTIEDIALFATALLNSDDAPFGADWVRESLRVQTGGLTPPRGLFWHPAPGTDPADDVWVHYGFTGTGLWISPQQGTWAALFTNKLFHTRDREPLTKVRNDFRAALFTP
ncbi:serine hydrolase domain-containing protein [Kitasatospora misakiensis]|uniref:Serine hydrolase domain-containing protein n=1 Tax=Kitasatospora misakiensis TaxID=67330 RepID=A0ABW0X7X0_9ACTN